MTSRRLAAAAALVVIAAALLAVLGAGGSARSSPAPAAPPGHPFSWLKPAGAPDGWRAARLPGGAATLRYPAGWTRVHSDRGTVSAELPGPHGVVRGYLNITPRQGRATLGNWARLRVEHLAGDDERHVVVSAVARGLRLGAARASCVSDRYTTSRARYRELACLVIGPRGGVVLVGAAPPASWGAEAGTIERSFAAAIG